MSSGDEHPPDDMSQIWLIFAVLGFLDGF